MKRRTYALLFMSLLLPSLFSFSARGATVDKKIEKNMSEKNWETVNSLLKSLPDKSHKQYNAKKKYTQAINTIVAFLRKYDDCVSREGGSGRSTSCYSALIEVAWKKVLQVDKEQKGLPVSKAFLADLNMKKDAALKKIREASDRRQSIDKYISEKNWETINSILEGLPDRSYKQYEAKKKYTQAIKAIVKFLQSYDRCESREGSPDTISSCYRILVKVAWADIDRVGKEQKGLPVSKEIVDDLNMKWRAAIKKVEGIAEERKNKEEYARLERARKERDRLARVEAVQRARRSDEYKKADVICDICDAIGSKRTREAIIAEEKRYADKYGTVNLTLIDKNKQGIKRDDSERRRSMRAYKKMTGKPFNTARCKNMEQPCQLAYEVEKKLVKKYLAEQQESRAGGAAGRP